METAGRLRSFAAALPAVLGLSAWLLAAALAEKIVPAALVEHPRLAQITIFGIATIGGFGGLVGFCYSAESIEFFVRGYRIRSADGTQWVYEERAADGSIEELPFGYKPLADEYRPPCEVWLPSQERWDEEVPSWARNRVVQLGPDRVANSPIADVTRCASRSGAGWCTPRCLRRIHESWTREFTPAA